MQYIDDRIAAHEENSSWVQDVMSFAALDEMAVSDFLGCFCTDRKTGVGSIKLPDWAFAAKDKTYQDKRAEVMRERAWQDDMSLAGIMHLELIAHDAYKRSLHHQWLSALDNLAAEGNGIKMLDYRSEEHT